MIRPTGNGIVAMENPNRNAAENKSQISSNIAVLRLPGTSGSSAGTRHQ
jgi:hypothetical protein